MDSITQAVLGATVADACLGRVLGRKAVWWGLVFGTLPDLDVLARPAMDAVSFLSWHRGWSHGVLAMALGPIFLAALLRWIHGAKLSWQRAYVATFLIWATHVLIDCLTVYGTGLWEPFSSTWVECGLLFIIDPAFTFPLLTATLAALIFQFHVRWRPWLTMVALTMSTLYIAWAALAKSIISNRFEAEMQHAAIEPITWLTAPTPGNTFLWRCLIKEERDGEMGYWIGYASLWDKTDHVRWRRVSARTDLIGKQEQSRAVEKIQWFSMGYWIVRRDEQGLAMADLRFGETTMAVPDLEGVAQPWIFRWRISDDGEGFSRTGISYPDDFSFSQIWDRIWGQRFAWEQAAKLDYDVKTRSAP